MVFVVQANTLFETLALNLVRYPDLDEATMPDCPEDCPCWEMDDPFSPDRSLPYGYLDYLTWQNRRVLLIPDQADGRIVVRRMTAAPALRLDERTLNPMIHYRLDERRGPVPLVFTEERALWRDSAVLFCPSDTGYQLPRGFRWVAELVDEGFLEKSQTRRFLALGMSKKQAKVNFSRCEWMPLPLRCLQETDLMDALQTALQMAEATAKKLWGAARTLATLLLDAQADSASGRRPDRKDLDSLTQGWGIERRYWSRLEVPFRAILETLPDWREQVLENWRLKLIQAVWETFDPVTDSLGSDSRTLKALVRARSQLAAGLAETLPRASDAQRIES
jgi:CRISPR system Cascade subunit CasA